MPSKLNELSALGFVSLCWYKYVEEDPICGVYHQQLSHMESLNLLQMWAKLLNLFHGLPDLFYFMFTLFMQCIFKHCREILVVRLIIISSRFEGEGVSDPTFVIALKQFSTGIKRSLRD